MNKTPEITAFWIAIDESPWELKEFWSTMDIGAPWTKLLWNERVLEHHGHNSPGVHRFPNSSGLLQHCGYNFLGRNSILEYP